MLLFSQSALKIFADSKLNATSLAALVQLVEEKTFPANSNIFQARTATPAALYLVRSGTVTKQEGNTSTTIGPGGYFGDDLLKADVGAGSNFSPSSPSTVKPEYSAKTGKEKVTVGMLSLAACRKVMDTRKIGTSEAASKGWKDSMVEKGVTLDQLSRHTILGAGTFGQVWLVSRKTSSGKRMPYALKVRSVISPKFGSPSSIFFSFKLGSET